MKLKPVVVLFFLAFISYSVQAQKKPSAILRAGVNLANVSITNDGRFDEANTLTSFQFGLLADIHVVPAFSIQTGVIYSGKGSKTQHGDPETDLTYYKATSNPYYIEIPLNFVVKTPGVNKFFLGAGPYLAIGVDGKNKVEGQILGTYFKNEEAIQFSDDDPTTLDYEEGAGFGIMKRVDYGFNFSAGVETKMVIVSGQFGLGLAKLQSGSNSSADDRNKHRVISFTLGFKL